MVRRFVIQEHTTPEGVHWDLMLEQDGALTTFRLEQEPAYCLTHEARAEKIFDHPLRFLTYEGPVQRETGKVRIADSGVYLRRDDRDGLLTLELNGAILRGDFVLIRLNNAEWRFKPQHPPG
ncbi:MAG TPA: DNA polymerase ligase N-terminal domain-containing protein [Sedimentisphaerales bacterium]|nr:DNA polymerase ligase N-terminal domain-containing protein [Sedimentisphaerales bacterium]